MVSLLDEGGYGRYDFKTASKLLEMSQNLQNIYGSNLNRLYAECKNNQELETRLQSLAKGIGPLTVNIFLRELRGLWRKADPLPSEFALTAAYHLGLLPPNLESPKKTLEKLKRIWKKCKIPGYNFSDFEAALVAYGLEMRRKAKRG